MQTVPTTRSEAPPSVPAFARLPVLVIAALTAPAHLGFAVAGRGYGRRRRVLHLRVLSGRVLRTGRTPPAYSGNRSHGRFPPPGEDTDTVLFLGEQPESLRPWLTDVRPVGDPDTRSTSRPAGRRRGRWSPSGGGR